MLPRTIPTFQVFTSKAALRFQLLVSCIMYFISGLSSMHKFSIYFYPGLQRSFTCKVEEIAVFLTFFLEFHFSQTLLTSFSSCATKTLFQGMTYPASCCRFLGTPLCQKHLRWLKSSPPAATLCSLVQDQPAVFL